MLIYTIATQAVTKTRGEVVTHRESLEKWHEAGPMGPGEVQGIVGRKEEGRGIVNNSM